MIYLASDHAGYHLKEKIKEFLKENDFEYEDLGPSTYDKTDDYPDYIIPAANKVAEQPEKNKAIILGGSGQGEAIAANKINGIRAIVFYGGPKDIITLSRTHNDANILSLGARFINPEEINEIISLWLETSFSNKDRHLRRINKINDFENNK